MKYNFIAIEGNIGSGKTSLANKIAFQNASTRLILENFSDNQFLPKFYHDSEKYAFPLELSFLIERYRQLELEYGNFDLLKKPIVSDYYFYKSLIFAKANLKEQEFNIYSSLFNIICGSWPKPDLLIYLDLDIDKLQKNILKRGRNYEQNISDEYLIKIQSSYLTFLEQQKNMRILVLDINDIDFVNNPSHYSKLINKISDDYPLGFNKVIL